MRATICLLMLITVGCGEMVVTPRDIAKPDGPDNVWKWIAKDVEDGDVTDSTKLELMVNRLRKKGLIDDNAVDRFYAAFPGIKEKELPITANDAPKLRAL